MAGSLTSWLSAAVWSEIDVGICFTLQNAQDMVVPFAFFGGRDFGLKIVCPLILQSSNVH